MSKFQACLEGTPYCCGFNQAGGFTEDEQECPDFTADTADELIRDLLNESVGKPVMFNFVKKKDYEGNFAKKYEAHELRDAVKAHPNVQHIGTHINPGSKNKIDSYIIFGYKDE